MLTVVRASTLRLDPTLTLVVTGVGLMAVTAISTVLGMVSTIIALGMPLAAAAAVFVVRRPAVMLSVMVVAELTNLSAVMAKHISLPIFAASLGLGLLTVVLALRDPVMVVRLNRGTLLCMILIGCYVVTQMATTLTSQDPEVSRAALRDSIINAAFLAVILVLTQLTGKPWTVAAAFVIPLAVISALCLISQVGFGSAMSFGGLANVTEASGQLVTTPRFAGPLEDSNFWGRHLAMALPLTGALIVRACALSRYRTALSWAAAMVVLLAGVYLTQSRGTLLATAIAFFVWVVASGATARRWGLISLPLVALTALIPGIGDRMVALATDVSERGHAIDPSVVERLNAQEMAWAMFRDRPWFGFGPSVFETEVPRYAGMVNTTVFHPAAAPHNLYAQLASDSGVVGILGWIAFVGGFVLLLATRVARMSVQAADSHRTLGAAVLAGLIAWSFASVFLHLAYFRTFAIMIGLAGALAASAHSSRVGEVRARRADNRREVLAAVFGVTAVTAMLIVSAGITHTASQRVTLEPTMQSGGDAAYALDLKSRDTLLPTYAAMMATDEHGFTAVSDSVRGVITVSVPDVDIATAQEDLDTALTESRRNLADFGANAWYAISAVGSPRVHSGSTHSTIASLAAVTLGALLAAGSVRSCRPRSDRSHRNGRADCIGRSRERTST